MIKAPSFIRSFLLVLALLGLLLSVFILPGRPPVAPVTGTVRVQRVVDGDTLKLDGGERVRLLGIDTPEMHESGKLLRDAARSGQDAGTIQKLGRRAYEYVRPLIEGKNVRLEFDIQTRDKYGRLLAYVYLEDGRFLNKMIIENGYASPLTIPPNIKHADEFRVLYKTAREQHLGLWADENGASR